MNFTICFKFPVNVEVKQVKIQRFRLVYVKMEWLVLQYLPIKQLKNKFGHLPDSFLRKSITELLFAGSCSNNAGLKQYISNL